MRSKEELDLSVDPSPELVIEIDVTSTSIHKDPIYAQLGIREVWRYDGNALRIGKLVGEGYVASETSKGSPPRDGYCALSISREQSDRDASRAREVVSAVDPREQRLSATAGLRSHRVMCPTQRKQKTSISSAFISQMAEGGRAHPY